MSGLPGGSMVDHPPTMGETWVPSLGREDPLEEGMATPSSTVAWRIPWTAEPGGPQGTGSQRVRRDSVTQYWAADCCDSHRDWRWPWD